MAKKNKQTEEKKGAPKSALEQLIGIATGAGLAPEAKEKVEQILNGDADFFQWWQRRPDEVITSAQNILKALGVVGGYVAYEHFDPLEGSKVDNAAVLIGSIVLLALLVIPQSNELGVHFRRFEQSVIVAFASKEENAQKEVLKFVRELSNRQEGRLASILKGVTEENLVKILDNSTMRELLKEFIGLDPTTTELEEAVKKAKEFIKQNWPKVKDTAKIIDEKTTKPLSKANDWLEKQWWVKNPNKPSLLSSISSKIKRCYK